MNKHTPSPLNYIFLYITKVKKAKKQAKKQKFQKFQKLINIAHFNKNVAPGKKLKN